VFATSLLYTGTQIVTVPNSIALGATLSSSVSGCKVGQTIKFELDVNPITLAAGPYLLGTGVTGSDGKATAPSVSTTGWLDGVYGIIATYGGSVNGTVCLPSCDEVCLAVASPGYAAEGGGWWTSGGFGRLNFGFTVRKVPNSNPVQFKGQCLVINNGKWRLKGTLNQYSRVGNTGVSAGYGKLYYWDGSTWVRTAEDSVHYSICFVDSGQGGKNSYDKFGVHIEHVVTCPPEPCTLPNSSPILLKGGNITIQNGAAKLGEDFIPEEYALFQNYPNPFNPSTTIQFDLPEDSRVSVTIYDILGREVIRLVDEAMDAGRYKRTWESQDRSGRSVASGVYFIRIEAHSLVSERMLITLKKMLLLK